jgi:hypothetical protein
MKRVDELLSNKAKPARQPIPVIAKPVQYSGVAPVTSDELIRESLFSIDAKNIVSDLISEINMQLHLKERRIPLPSSFELNGVDSIALTQKIFAELLIRYEGAGHQVKLEFCKTSAQDKYSRVYLLFENPHGSLSETLDKYIHERTIFRED